MTKLAKYRRLESCIYPDLRENLSNHIDALCALLDEREKLSLRDRHALEKTEALPTADTKRSVLTFRRRGGRIG